jgi:hypothetical protein
MGRLGVAGRGVPAGGVDVVLDGFGAGEALGGGGIVLGAAGLAAAGLGVAGAALFGSAAGVLRALLAVDFAFAAVVSLSAAGVFAFGLRGLAGAPLLVVPSSELSSSAGFVRRGFFGVAGGSIIAPPLALEHYAHFT